MITTELDLLEEFLEDDGLGVPPSLETHQYYFVPKLKVDIEDGKNFQRQIKEYFHKGIQPQIITNFPEEGLYFELNLMKSSLKTRETCTKNTQGSSYLKRYQEQNIMKRVTFNLPERQNKFNRREHFF